MKNKNQQKLTLNKQNYKDKIKKQEEIIMGKSVLELFSQKEVLNYFEKNIGNVFHGNGTFYTYKLLNSYILNKFVLFIAENDKKSTNEKENIFDSFINVFSTYQGLTDFKIYKNKSIGQIASEKKGVLSKILKNNMFSSREDVLNEVNYFEYFVQNYGFELLKKETFFDFSKIQENSIKVKETDYFDNNEYLVNIYIYVIYNNIITIFNR